MKPFDKVSINITKNSVEYTCGAEVLCTYTKDGTNFAIVNIAAPFGTETMTVKQSDCTAI